jgi:hypothetical protein
MSGSQISDLEALFISGGKQPLHANYGNFNLSHTMFIQRDAQRRWEE